jgi:hypothetical protein
MLCAACLCEAWSVAVGECFQPPSYGSTVQYLTAHQNLYLNKVVCVHLRAHCNVFFVFKFCACHLCIFLIPVTIIEELNNPMMFEK